MTHDPIRAALHELVVGVQAGVEPPLPSERALVHGNTEPKRRRERGSRRSIAMSRNDDGSCHWLQSNATPTASRTMPRKRGGRRVATPGVPRGTLREIHACSYLRPVHRTRLAGTWPSIRTAPLRVTCMTPLRTGWACRSPTVPNCFRAAIRPSTRTGRDGHTIG